MHLTDELRTAISLLITNGVALAVAFGVELSQEQTAGILAAVNNTLIVIWLLFKKGQGATSLRRRRG